MSLLHPPGQADNVTLDTTGLYMSSFLMKKLCRKHHLSFVKRLHQDLVICRYLKRNYNLSSTIQMAQNQGEVEHWNKQVGTGKENMWNSIRQTVKPKKG